MKKQIKFLVHCIFCLYICSSSNLLLAQTTSIPDANFEQALVNQGIDSDGLVNGQILNSDASSVTSLNVSNSNISDLTGIQAFTSLQSLRCQDNSLTSLNVTNNTALDFLYCEDNQLTTLNLANNTALETLICNNNQLTALNLSNNPVLDFISCSYNQLTSITLNNNNTLEYLACTNNQLTTLNLSNKTNLERLYSSTNLLNTLTIAPSAPLKTLECQNNQLTALSITTTNSSTLEVFQCQNNQLTTINISNNPVLQEFRCSNNQLTTLNIASSSTLDFLGCENNQLATLNLANNTALQHVYCSNNQLTTLNLNSNTALQYLECQNNQITTLNLLASTSLIRLNCEFNQLTSLNIPSNNTLQDIYCDHNQLPSLDLTNNTALEELRCSNNLLTNLNLTNNATLGTLSCDTNQLANLNTSGAPVLVYLNCYNNQLARLDLTNNTILEGLGCNDNQLTSLNISNNNALLYISCQNNQLTTLNLTSNPSLSSINCSNNRLTTLDLRSNTSLSGLACSDNQLSNLSLANKTGLRFLDCGNNQLTTLDLHNTPLLQYFICNNNQLQYLNLKDKASLVTGSGVSDTVGLVNNLHNMVICVDDASAVSSNPKWVKDPTASYIEVCPNTTLLGEVRADINTNCMVENTDPIVQNAILSISDGVNTIYRKSNNSGAYTGELDTGNYTINILPPNPYFSACNNQQTTRIDSINDRDTINWALQTTHTCPFMVANIAAPFLRATGGGSNYTINYCNQGTAPTYDAYIEVTIDTALNVLSTSIPVLSQLGNIYTFDLDTVNIGECGSFTINVIADSTLVAGQTLCSDVHIYPDSLCNNTWNGPIIQTSGTCQTDSIIFTIENIGGNMNTPLSYIVIEDNIIMRDTTFLLSSNTTQTITVNTQPGSIYRIEAQQDVNYPSVLGPHIAQFNIINCQQGGLSNLGLPLNYYNGSTAPWIDIDCQPLVAAYDPNDKTPQPLGYGPQHYITNPTPIEYRVRFQNTGNDTAFNVVILDTISTHLDIATLKMQAASDDYTWSLTSGNALRVNFPNIKLVDSTTNEPLSHGFFTYEITPKANLPLETRIENTAAIYFDYNPPIFTNTTFHTIGENFIPKVTVGVTKINQDHIQINAYPNPFDQMTTIAVEGEIFETLEVIVTDVAGRILQNKQVQHQNQIQLHRDNLLQGIYLYQIKGNDRLIGTGKLIVR